MGRVSRKFAIAVSIAATAIPVIVTVRADPAVAGAPSGCMPTVQAAVPPAGFNPVTATSAQLRCFGFPSRPASSAKLSRWNYFMSRAINYVYPTSAISESAPAGVPYSSYTGENWAGYHARANQNTQLPYLQWYEADADTVVRNAPYTYTSGNCTGMMFGQWVGLGGDTSGTNLSQIGVEEMAGNPPSYRAWWQVAANQTPVTVLEVPVSPGDTVYLSAHYNIGQASTTFYVQDVTTATYTSFTKSAGNPTQDVDFDMEEPASWPNGPFINFAHIPLYDITILGVWGSSGQYALNTNLNQVNYRHDTMTDSFGDVIADPNAYGSEPYGFDIYTNSNYTSC